MAIGTLIGLAADQSRAKPHVRFGANRFQRTYCTVQWDGTAGLVPGDIRSGGVVWAVDLFHVLGI